MIKTKKIKKCARDEDKKPKNFHCSCNKSYQNKDSLRKHQKKHDHKQNEQFKHQQPMRRTGKPRKNIVNKKDNLIMDEEIYQKTLNGIFDIERTPILTTENGFIDLKTPEVLIVIEALLHENTCFFINEVKNLMNEKEIEKITYFSNNLQHCDFRMKLKKLAVILVNFANFLNKEFFEFFFVLNVDILEQYEMNEKISNYLKKLGNFENYKEKIESYEEKKKEFSEFEINYMDNMRAFLNQEKSVI